MLQHLSKVIAVPSGSKYRVSRFHEQPTIIVTIKMNPDKRCPWNDNVISIFERQIAKHGGYNTRTFVHKDYLVCIGIL